MLGQVPPHALAVAVIIDAFEISLLFQLSEHTIHDESDIDEIVSELQALVGSKVETEWTAAFAGEKRGATE